MEPIVIQDFENKDVKNQDELSQWHSCCTGKKTDSRLLKFVFVYIIIFMVIAFSLFKLNTSQTCEDTQTFLSLLTLVLGVILPSPRQ